MGFAGVEAYKDETFELDSMIHIPRDNREISRTVSTTRLLELLLAIDPSKNISPGKSPRERGST
jgi:hypothetical protein